ncbi:uncharacterized protein LOC129575664 isoform X2 [Sitodiplosis mosellana]|uniref:uncharacterized protein LOC129575664 isoform X2 n=1 Tax=Sitodiplosis mosellana TaxID=263140 RepID=UPI002444D422|nr:uncharacterized protein LOC129575664 isoform X2 [Sitodiplosis mosellana]
MNVVSLSNINKYAVIKFYAKSPHHFFIHRWFAGNSGSLSLMDRQRKKDGIDNKFQLIYKPPNNSLLMTATSFGAFGAFTCPAFLLQYTFDRFYGDNTELIEQVSSFQLGVMGTAAIASIIILYFCRSIPLRIYNNGKEYTAIFPSSLPLLTRKFCFVKGDIKDKKSSGWGRNLLGKLIKPGFETASFYRVKDTHIFLTIKCFEKPVQFYEMFPNTAKYARKIKQLDPPKR